jgi:MFS family permease
MPMQMLHILDVFNRRKGPHKFSKALYLYLFCIFLLFAGFTAFYAFFPIFLVDEAGMQSSAIFLVYLASQATSVAFYTRVGRWVREKGSKRTQIIGSGARTVLFPSFLAVVLLDVDPVSALIMILILHALVGLCWAMINVSGSMIVSNLASNEIQGEAFGAYNAVQGFGSIAGPIAGGMICQFFGYAAGFLSASAFILLGIAVLLKLKVDAN